MLQIYSSWSKSAILVQLSPRGLNMPDLPRRQFWEIPKKIFKKSAIIILRHLEKCYRKSWNMGGTLKKKNLEKLNLLMQLYTLGHKSATYSPFFHELISLVIPKIIWKNPKKIQKIYVYRSRKFGDVEECFRNPEKLPWKSRRDQWFKFFTTYYS